MKASLQMLLFLDLPIPAAVLPPKPRTHCRPWRCAIEAVAQVWLQTPIRAPLRALERDDLHDDDDKPIQRTVSAAAARKVRTTALSSIFTIADAAKAAKMLQQCGRFGDAAGFTPIIKVVRDGDRTRVVRLLPQDTEEWQIAEQKRRAKQKPPKPPKGWQTRGKKVRAFDGEQQ